MKHLQRLLILGLLLEIVAGCYHPRALYEEPPRSPLEKGKIAEQQYDYAEAAQQYEAIDDIAVQRMSLNHLASAWESVNASIIRSQMSVKGEPLSAEAHLKLAQHYYQKGLLCTRYSRESLGSYPRDFVLDEQEYYYNAALEEAEKALRLQSDLVDARLLIGEIYLANHMNKKALTELKKLIATQPEYAKGYYAVGKVYFDMGNYEMSERYFIKAIKLDPALYDAYYLLGRFFLKEELYEYAAHTFLEILRHKPEDSPAFDMLIESCHELGKLYMEEERYTEAIRLFQEILQAKASYDVHQSFLLAREKQAELAYIKEQQAALEEMSSQESPDIAEFEDLLFADQRLDVLINIIDPGDDESFAEALIRLQENDFQIGYDILQKSPEANRTNPYRSLALAYALQHLEREEEAKQILRQLTGSNNVESRIQLWSWLALRSLGEELDPTIIYRVLGVVIEIYLPDQQGVDIIAAYLDGRVRYLGHDGNTLFWDRTEGNISSLAQNVIYTAQAIARDFPSELEHAAIKDDNIRISLLTCGGVRSMEDKAERVKQEASMISPIFSVGNNLLETLLAIYNKA